MPLSTIFQLYHYTERNYLSLKDRSWEKKIVIPSENDFYQQEIS